MIISIEVPVFKGQFLQQCINSVLKQTSHAWELSLVWDGGDELSRQILERTEAEGHSNIKVYFTENQGIAKARAFLSSRNTHPYILPLDDDDELAPNAVELFTKAATANPWASLVRARRGFINQQSEIVDEEQWFPFAPRNYYRGMVTDVFNQAQPYLIRRSAYERTAGWRGFDDFRQAGEDCDIFLQLEEVAHFELVDELLYYYRLHNDRASNELTSAAAFEMWRRLADDALQRMKLNLVRKSSAPPFIYEEKEPVKSTVDNIDFVVGHNSPLIHTLKDMGILSSSIIEVPEAADNRMMQGFKASGKGLICFMDHTVMLNDAASLPGLADALNKTGADILAPAAASLSGTADADHFTERSWLTGNCLLVKREVMLATGGFDHACIPERLRVVDLCIQARRRGFTCYEAYVPGISYLQPPEMTWSEEELLPLKQKWHAHEALVPSTKDLNRLSGEGARL